MFWVGKCVERRWILGRGVRFGFHSQGREVQRVGQAQWFKFFENWKNSGKVVLLTLSFE